MACKRACISFIMCGACDRITRISSQCNIVQPQLRIQFIKRKFTVELTPMPPCTLILHCQAINFVMEMQADVRIACMLGTEDRQGVSLLCLNHSLIHSFAYGIQLTCFVRMRSLQRSHTPHTLAGVKRIIYRVIIIKHY